MDFISKSMITRILLMGMWSKDMSSLIWCLVVCELEFQKCSKLAESGEWQCQKHPRKSGYTFAVPCGSGSRQRVRLGVSECAFTIVRVVACCSSSRTQRARKQRCYCKGSLEKANTPSASPNKRRRHLRVSALNSPKL